MGIMFVFQGSTMAILNNGFLVNCPSPLQDQTVTGAFQDGTFFPQDGQVHYNVGYVITNYGNSSQTDVGTFFQCKITGGNPAVLVQNKPYGAALGNCATFCIPYGSYAYYGDVIYSTLGKLPAYINLLYSYFVAPAQITQIPAFTYIQVFLLSLISLGIFMVIRSGG